MAERRWLGRQERPQGGGQLICAPTTLSGTYSLRMGSPLSGTPGAFSTPQNTGGLQVPQSPHKLPGSHCTEMWSLLAGPGGSGAGVHPCIAFSLLSRPSCLETGRQPQPLRSLLETWAPEGLAIHSPNFLNALLPGSELGNLLYDLQYLIAC